MSAAVEPLPPAESTPGSNAIITEALLAAGWTAIVVDRVVLLVPPNLLAALREEPA